MDFIFLLARWVNRILRAAALAIARGGFGAGLGATALTLGLGLKAETTLLKVSTVEELFGSWSQAQQKHFNDGALFDRIFQH